MTGVARFFEHGRGAAFQLVGIHAGPLGGQYRASRPYLGSASPARRGPSGARGSPGGPRQRALACGGVRADAARRGRRTRAAAGSPLLGDQPRGATPLVQAAWGDPLLTVATGSGKTMVKEGGASVWKFETPRGRLVVQSKEEAPVWAPPDWHYVEQSRKRGLGLARLEIGRALTLADGTVITVAGNDVVRVLPDGRRSVMQASDGRENRRGRQGAGAASRHHAAEVRGRPRHPPPEHG